MSKDPKVTYKDTDGMEVWFARGGIHQTKIKNINEDIVMKETIKIINEEIRRAKKLLPYDEYRCGYIDALITIKKKLKEKDNE